MESLRALVPEKGEKILILTNNSLFYIDVQQGSIIRSLSLPFDNPNELKKIGKKVFVYNEDTCYSISDKGQDGWRQEIQLNAGEKGMIINVPSFTPSGQFYGHPIVIFSFELKL
ncbi:MAG: hypothetical protein GWP10_01050 [Nitrospiraceae bacterium]|nr:hypothetical protein [Nitrospiraceae bacterium]